MKLISEPLYSKRRAAGFCVSAHCDRQASKKKRFCSKHAHQWRRFTDPAAYFYNLLKGNAKRRGKGFELTLQEFREFCTETGYLELKGRFAGMYTIDRIRYNEGYKKGNLQILTNSQNVRKQWIDLKIRFGRYPTQAELDELYAGQDLETVIAQTHGEIEKEEGEEEVPF